MNAMKKAAGLAVTLTIAAGCVPAPYRTGRYPGPYVPVHPYVRPAPAEPVGGSVVGRWDNVMLLEAGTPVLVLMKSGQKESGAFTSADADMLRVLTDRGTVNLAQPDVMRVDRLPRSAREEYGEAAGRGAAAGAGVVGIMGLIAGRMPPARVFAAGAMIGAAQSANLVWSARTAVMVYLAR